MNHFSLTVLYITSQIINNYLTCTQCYAVDNSCKRYVWLLSVFVLLKCSNVRALRAALAESMSNFWT